MLGQPVSMLIPQVVGFRLDRRAARGRDRHRPRAHRHRRCCASAAWSASSWSSSARACANLPLADRATIGNMSPEYGATCGDLPGGRRDAALPRVHRPPGRARRAGRGLLPRAGPVPRRATPRRPVYSRHARARPRRRWSRRWPGRGARRTAWRSPTRPRTSCAELGELTRGDEHGPSGYDEAVGRDVPGERPADERTAAASRRSRPQPPRRPRHARWPTAASRARPRRGGDRRDHELHEHVEPVGDDRRRAARQEGGGARADAQAVGEDVSLAPGSKVVTDYLERAGLIEPLRAARLRPRRATAAPPASATPARCRRRSRRRSRSSDLVVCSVLSGNRNFEGRIHPEVKVNYLASPPLVRGLRAGRAGWTSTCVNEPLAGRASTCATSGRRQREIDEAIERPIESDMFRRSYGEVFEGDETWNGAARARGRPLRLGRRLHLRQAARPTSRACRADAPAGLRATIEGARVLALLGDSVTTDHISPAGAIKKDSPAGQLPARARRRAARLQLLRLAPRQPRGDDARHVRQRAAAQPARAGHRGRRSRVHGRRGDVDLRRRDALRRTRACRCACSRARSTAPARRATGRPRARGCSACAS